MLRVETHNDGQHQEDITHGRHHLEDWTALFEGKVAIRMELVGEFERGCTKVKEK